MNRRSLVLLALLGPLLGVLFALWAVPLPARLESQGSRVVLFRDGEPAYVFLSADDRWRITAELKEIDPAFVNALIRLEDKRFWYHPGADPLALLRAAALDLRYGEVVSGGSTLTMQLARLLEPRPRTLRSKVIELFRALQLELFLSKEEILGSYLTFAPYGRNIEGVRAASLAYFGHTVRDLSEAEIATLLAVPQSPASRYPTPAHRERLTTARDRILGRLGLASASLTPVPERMRPFPREVAHIAHWLAKRQNNDAATIPTTLDRGMQASVEQRVALVRRELAGKGIWSGCVVVLDHQTDEVVAMVGNLDSSDDVHGGQIATFAVPRSPGSALKPFLYAAALDRGLVLPEFLVQDIPVHYGDWSPRNYDGTFSGLVPLEQALSRSLNLPFVSLLERIGVESFVGMAGTMGVHSLQERPGTYGLALAAGGAELTPLEMAGLYATLARGGRYRPVLLQPKAAAGGEGIPVFSEGASWLTGRALALRDRPDFPARPSLTGLPSAIHWKTGTSAAHRDAWAAGYGPRHTAVVWLGNVDQEPSRSLVGAEVAAPLLFDVLEAVESPSDLALPQPPPPDDLISVEVCSYSGHLAGQACPQTRSVLALAQSVPTEPCPYHVQVEVDDATGLAVGPSCRSGGPTHTKVVLQWPAGLRRWLSDQHRRLPVAPPWAPQCQGRELGAPKLVSPRNGQVAHLVPGIPPKDQEIPFLAETHGPQTLDWFVDGAWLATAPSDERVWWTPSVGRHEVAVVCAQGGSAVSVLEVEPESPAWKRSRP